MVGRDERGRVLTMIACCLYLCVYSVGGGSFEPSRSEEACHGNKAIRDSQGIIHDIQLLKLQFQYCGFT